MKTPSEKTLTELLSEYNDLREVLKMRTLKSWKKSKDELLYKIEQLEEEIDSQEMDSSKEVTLKEEESKNIGVIDDPDLIPLKIWASKTELTAKNIRRKLRDEGIKKPYKWKKEDLPKVIKDLLKK